MFTTGQLGLATTAIFDPATSTWTKVADMKAAALVPVADRARRRPLRRASAATRRTRRTWADTPEVYDPAANTWTLLTGVSTPQVHEEEYPFSYLTPNGKVFTIGPAEDNSFFLDVANKTWTPVGGASGVINGSSVMYRPGKILYTGGAANIVNARREGDDRGHRHERRDRRRGGRSLPMGHARIYHTLTMLADGTVLAVGGEQNSDQSIVTTGVLPAEIWNPATETWTDVAPMAAARNYHSTAVLLPDARVLVAGGGHYQDGVGPGQYSAQIYSPPYLFKGPRPTITAAPAGTTYGSNDRRSPRPTPRRSRR